MQEKGENLFLSIEDLDPLSVPDQENDLAEEEMMIEEEK